MHVVVDSEEAWLESPSRLFQGLPATRACISCLRTILATKLQRLNLLDN